MEQGKILLGKIPGLQQSHRDGIPHGEGDFIVSANKGGQPNPDDRWVVNGLVFINTYEAV